MECEEDMRNRESYNWIATNSAGPVTKILPAEKFQAYCQDNEKSSFNKPEREETNSYFSVLSL